MIYDDIYLNETGALLEERLPYSRSFYATIWAGLLNKMCWKNYR